MPASSGHQHEVSSFTAKRRRWLGGTLVDCRHGMHACTCRPLRNSFNEILSPFDVPVTTTADHEMPPYVSVTTVPAVPAVRHSTPWPCLHAYVCWRYHTRQPHSREALRAFRINAECARGRVVTIGCTTDNNRLKGMHWSQRRTIWGSNAGHKGKKQFRWDSYRGDGGLMFALRGEDTHKHNMLYSYTSGLAHNEIGRGYVKHRETQLQRQQRAGIIECNERMGVFVNVGFLISRSFDHVNVIIN